MLTSEIKYDLSTDYNRLWELLEKGCKVAAFTYQHFKGTYLEVHSQLIEIFYHKESGLFKFGDFYFSTADDFFFTHCKKANIRYFDLKEGLE